MSDYDDDFEDNFDCSPDSEDPFERETRSEMWDLDFQDPGGNSALRRATENNPRNLPCPTCKEPNRLTPADVTLRYQCDFCADRDERGF